MVDSFFWCNLVSWNVKWDGKLMYIVDVGVDDCNTIVSERTSNAEFFRRTLLPFQPPR